MKLSNLPPGCSNEDIERAAGAYDEQQQHTPGPWTHGEEFQPDYPLLRVISVAAHGMVLAHVNAGWYDASEANARLITAAPDLLAALQLCERNLEPYKNSGVWDGTLSTIRAAIEKATQS